MAPKVVEMITKDEFLVRVLDIEVVMEDDPGVEMTVVEALGLSGYYGFPAVFAAPISNTRHLIEYLSGKKAAAVNTVDTW